MDMTGFQERVSPRQEVDWVAPPKIEIIAHRGASSLAPENTLSAIRLAWQQGCDAVEVDVHLSRDRQIMAIHDPSTRRTAGRSWRIAETSAARLRTLDVGHYKGATFTGERIPFLKDVLAGLPPRKRLFIDVKCGDEIVPVLTQAINVSGKMKQVVVIAFDLELLSVFKQSMPEVPAFWLRDTWLGRPHRASLVQHAYDAGVDGLDVHWSGVTAGFVRAVREAKLDLCVWTVDRLPTARRLVRMGIRALTTNDPGLYQSRFWIDERYMTAHESFEAVMMKTAKTKDAVPQTSIN
jgi:glycerophosphoryl diester phosphodiesterase